MVFTAQVKALGDLYGVQGIPDILIDTLQQTFGNCAQQLTHNGPVNFTAGISGTGQWVKATSLWTNASGNDSYVLCQQVTDRTGNSYVIPKNGVTQTIKVYLPRCGGMGDPNVRAGDVIVAGLDNNADYFCLSSYMDDAIGISKMWYGSSANIRGGWRIVTGAAGRIPIHVGGNSGTTNPYDTNGTYEHTHTISDTGDSSVTIGSASATIDPATVGLTFSQVPSREISITGMQLWGGGYVDTTPVTLTGTGAGSELETQPAYTMITVDPHTGQKTEKAQLVGSVSGTLGQAYITAISGTASGTTASATTGIAIAAHDAHTHTISTHYQNYVAPAPGGANFADIVNTTTGATSAGSHAITDPGHVHTFSGVTVTISDSTGHNHSLENMSVVIGEHDHKIPDLTHKVNDPRHKHSIDLSSLTFGVSPETHYHSVPISDLIEGILVTNGTATIPGFTPELSGDGSHTHTITGLTITASGHHHTVPNPSTVNHIQPVIGCYLIERFE